jgi:hypothetical protein
LQGVYKIKAMKSRNLLALILVICVPFTATGQKTKVKGNKKFYVDGVVTNSAAQPVVNAAVFVDSTYSDNTDSEGSYKVATTPESNKILVYSPENGYGEALINGQSTINFTLNTKTANLPKYVVQNYKVGKAGKSKVKKVNVYTDVFQMIRQEVPGVVVSGHSIMVQGPNSFLGSHEPLYVVDGHIVPSIDYVNPQEVKSIRLLKGSEATIYGTEGANGVISITLIKGGDKQQ